MLFKHTVQGKVMKKERSSKGNIFVQVYDGQQLITVFDGKDTKSGLLDMYQKDDEIEILTNAISDNIFFQATNS